MATAITASVDNATSQSRGQSRKPVKTSMHRAMNLFFHRDDDELKLGTRRDYELALMLLEEYINTFGCVLLRSAEIEPTFSRTRDGWASKRYDPASLASLFRGFIEDTQSGEPLYVVSRVKSGKLWFIYYAGQQYEEFGPVSSVPLGVSDLVKPGWLIDCEFGKYNGRWQIKKIGDVLPV